MMFVQGHHLMLILVLLSVLIVNAAKKTTCKERVQKIKNTLKTIEAVEKQCKVKIPIPGQSVPLKSMIWSAYTRWGRTTCPDKAEVVYQGVAGGSEHRHQGSGADYVCLPMQPEWGRYTEGSKDTAGLMYGAEYEIDSKFYTNNRAPFLATNAPNKEDSFSLHDNDVPCIVCQVAKSEVLMIPALFSCPTGWRMEYRGYLVAEHYKHPGNKAHVCMDEAPEALTGGQENKNGALFYTVQARCGSLPCPSYVEGRELTCVVCSK